MATPSGPRQLYDLITLLVRRREALGLSQGDLARKAGTSRKSIVQWEGGHEIPGGENLCRWAAALDVTLTPVTSP